MLYLQDILIAVKKLGNTPENITIWNEIICILWKQLETGLSKFDDQLLCATCFYSVLALIDKQEYYLKCVKDIIKEELQLKQQDKKEGRRIVFAVSLMYGMFQSSLLKQIPTTEHNIIIDVLDVKFKLLQTMAYEYSQFTFIVFKTISSFKKVIGTDLQQHLLREENILSLLNLICHNWENPITGVRDLNRDIFGMLLTVMNEDLFEKLIKEIDGFYWNKAKYLMLAEVINQSHKDIFQLIDKTDWTDALVSSLHKPGLVSAGTDMYFAVLKKLKSDDDWQRIFKKSILDILNSSAIKAIENFSNYWCLTTFKRYSVLSEFLLQELSGLDNVKHKVYCSIGILKQANKLGWSIQQWDTAASSDNEKIVLDGLEHCNNQIRLAAFEIVCLSQNKAMPSKLHYQVVTQFLKNNVNSDCTVLRISMLKSFSNFLTNLHISYLNYFNDNNENDVQNIKLFCKQFQTFIIYSLEVDGNYQRKLTSIKLLHNFIDGLKSVPKKRQKQTRMCSKALIDMVMEGEHWVLYDDNVIKTLIKLLKDPAEDIRATVSQLLLEIYSKELSTTQILDLLIQDALKCISSKFFYEINCGQSMFRLVINILLQESVHGNTFKSVEDVFNFAFNKLVSEAKSNRGIIETIENGKQLHSYMNILHAVLDVCQQNKKKTISKEQTSTLLDVLKTVSNQFDWEESTTSSDFSKMSDMVEHIITSSGYNGGNDDTKISGLHQIVLNCLWLNVKASGDLSALLIRYQVEDDGIDVCKKALDIISHVLESCRHKGAIEAAGSALGLSIRHLTSLPDSTNISGLPFTFLKSKLSELISEAARMASVTRRGAGLSIMVHRIVSSDSKRGKPLFHYFMKTILEVCNKVEDIPSNSQDEDIEKDLPKAIYIHFLTRIVTDSSLASEMMFYSAELAELAFGNLTSPYWQIRNAALQMYGALIQKLIGQKKASGNDQETVATVACDELRTHSPKLWKHVLTQLRCVEYGDKLQYHSNLVPILNMLANIARRYNFSSDLDKQKITDNELLKTLMLLLDSPIYTVRRLTAKCISNIYNLDHVQDYILSQEITSENNLHGNLMLVSIYKKITEHSVSFDAIRIKFSAILESKEHAYLCKEIFDEIFWDSNGNTNIEETLKELNDNAAPGNYLWAKSRLQKSLSTASWDALPGMLKIILSCNDCETYCKIILEKVEEASDLPDKIIIDLTNILLANNNKFESGIIWKILYQLSLKMDQTILSSKITGMGEVYKHMGKGKVSYKLRYILPFAARLFLQTHSDDENMLHVVKIVESMTDPDVADVEMRYIAAMANNELVKHITNSPGAVKIIAIKSALILLHDEDEDVRMLSTEFYRLITNTIILLQPYLCLHYMMDYKFLVNLLDNSEINLLKQKLLLFVDNIRHSKVVDEYNPFSSDSSNIYMELNEFQQLIVNMRKD